MTNQTVIKPIGEISLLGYLREIWHYRELLYVFVWRDVKVRYKQSILGISWVLFQPLVTTGIFSVFFGKIAKIPSDGLPYPIFVLVGLIVWNFFANALSSSSQSLVASENMLKKVYFPRLLIPLSSILTAGVDFLVSLVLFVFGCLYFGRLPKFPQVLALLILIPIFLLFTLGLGLFTSALNVKYRDVKFILPFFIQTGLFVTPVIFPLSVIYDFRKWLLVMNPLTGIIETAREVISDRAQLDFNIILISLFISLLVFALGFWFFRKTEGYFADIV
jgi:lipopolysaccharide transport system permease protein